MENPDMIGRIIDIAPNMIGFIFAVMVMGVILKNEWARYNLLQSKFDALQSKTIEIALSCKDEQAKEKMLSFQRQQSDK